MELADVGTSSHVLESTRAAVRRGESGGGSSPPSVSRNIRVPIVWAGGEVESRPHVRRGSLMRLKTQGI